MAITVEINEIDVSDEVRSGKFREKDRKRDYSPKASSVKMVVDGEFFTPVKDQPVEILVDGTGRWLGWIEDFTFNHKAGAWNLDVRNYLLKMEQKLVTYENLHAFISADGAGGAKYIASDNEGYPNVTIYHLLQKIFEANGLALNLSAIDSQDVLEKDGVLYNIEELCMDENMIYALNQAYAINHTKIAGGGEDYHRNKIKCWDLVRFLCSWLGISLRYTGSVGSKTYYATPQGRAENGFIDPAEDVFYSISDDDKFSYKEKTVLGSPMGYSYSVVQSRTRADYSNEDEDEITQEQFTTGGSGNGLKSIPIYNNLRVLLRDAGGSAGDVLDTSGANHVFLSHLLMNKGDSIIFNYEREEIVCPIQLSSHQIMSEEVDFRTQQSKIIQEVNTRTSA